MDESSRENAGACEPETIGFSIVVPSLNQARFLREAIDSLLSQEYPDLEVIVVDGASTDGSVDVLRSYGDRVLWTSENDSGQSDALAKGFAKASREWLAWLNADDIQVGQALFRVAGIIRRNPSARVVVGQGHYMDEDGAPTGRYPSIAVGPGVDVSRELFEKGYVAQPSVFFHRSAYEAVGGVDRSLHFAMDYDLWVRLARRGLAFARLDEDISGNRWHESAKSVSQLLPLLAEAVNVQLREYGRVSPYFVQAVSDNLYASMHSRHRGDRTHLLYRTLYFKSVWLWLNLHSPGYCFWGLLTRNISKSGPVVGDTLTVGDIAGRFWRRIKLWGTSR